MSKEIDVQQELRKLEGRMEEGLKTLQETMMEQKKIVDEFVKAKPYVALGIVFVAGLTLGALAGLLARSRD
ncbi:MAG: hypothetical protein QW057_01185 [Candidatus Bathyarchaeia archaeon]